MWLRNARSVAENDTRAWRRRTDDRRSSPQLQIGVDQSVTYLISESRGMAMRKARILATIPDPLPIPEEGIAPDVENEIPKEPSNGGDVIESNVSDVQMIETSVEENLSDSELEPEIVDENVQNWER